MILKAKKIEQSGSCLFNELDKSLNISDLYNLFLLILPVLFCKIFNFQ